MDYLYDEGVDTFRIEVAGAGFPLRAPPMPSRGSLASHAVHRLCGGGGVIWPFTVVHSEPRVSGCRWRIPIHVWT